MTSVQRLEICISDVSHWMFANRLKLNGDKTELLWTGSSYGFCSTWSQWAVNTARRSQPVIIHASTGSVSCQWPDDRLTLNLQRHLSMPSSCLVLMVATPCLPSPQRPVTDRLQPVVNAAARVVSGTRKFDRRLTRLLHAELLWLDISQRIQYKLGVMVH